MFGLLLMVGSGMACRRSICRAHLFLLCCVQNMIDFLPTHFPLCIPVACTVHTVQQQKELEQYSNCFACGHS